MWLQMDLKRHLIQKKDNHNIIDFCHCVPKILQIGHSKATKVAGPICLLNHFLTKYAVNACFCDLLSGTNRYN